MSPTSTTRGNPSTQTSGKNSAATEQKHFVLY